MAVAPGRLRHPHGLGLLAPAPREERQRSQREASWPRGHWRSRPRQSSGSPGSAGSPLRPSSGGARHGAGLAAAPGGGERGSRGARRSRGLWAPKRPGDLSLGPRAPCPGARRPGTASWLPTPEGRREQEGRDRPPLATAALPGRACPAAPASATARPSPARDSARNVKIKLVLGREERARPGRGSPGCRRERCCVMLPTWTPAFCPFSFWKSRRTREPRKAGFRVQNPHDQRGTRP